MSSNEFHAIRPWTLWVERNFVYFGKQHGDGKLTCLRKMKSMRVEKVEKLSMWSNRWMKRMTDNMKLLSCCLLFCSTLPLSRIYSSLIEHWGFNWIWIYRFILRCAVYYDNENMLRVVWWEVIVNFRIAQHSIHFKNDDGTNIEIKVIRSSSISHFNYPHLNGMKRNGEMFSRWCHSCNFIPFALCHLQEHFSFNLMISLTTLQFMTHDCFHHFQFCLGDGRSPFHCVCGWMEQWSWWEGFAW